MQAVVLEGIGGPEQLVLRELPAPTARGGQVVVEVRAVAINFARDADPPRALPADAGAAVDPGHRDRRRDRGRPRVLGLVRARRAVATPSALPVDEQWLFDLPDEASFEEGAAFLMAYLTAWIPLTRQVVIHPGARVLVHAAAGGVGSAAVVVARDLGAEVVATAGAADKLALPLSLGATQAVTYDRLGEIEPVDVVFDPVGGQLFADSIKLLRPLGAAIAIGFAGGLWQPIDPALLVGRNVGVQGFYLGRLMQRHPEVVREAALDLLRLWSAGKVRPIVGATFPLAEAAEAHRLVESGARPGRSCSSREGARHGWRGRARRSDGRAARGGGLRGRRPRSDDRLRRHRPDASGTRSARSTSPASTPACSAARPIRPRSHSTTYRRAMAVNVDGVVLGVRRLARVMPSGGRIVATASLAGLTAMPDDPVYAATKHAVVGFVRSVAPTLERAASINAVCPASPTRRCSAAWCGSDSTLPGSRS